MNAEMVSFWEKAHAENNLLSLSGHPGETILQGLGVYDVDFKGLHVLDIGVGMGYLSEYLSRHGAIVSSLDVSPTALEKTSLWSTWRYLDSEIDTIPANTFDFALSYCVVQHMDDVSLFQQMECVFRTLKDDGKFFFQFSFPHGTGDTESSIHNMQNGMVNRSHGKVSEMVWKAGGFVQNFQVLGTYPQFLSGWSVCEARKRR